MTSHLTKYLLITAVGVAAAVAIIATVSASRVQHTATLDSSAATRANPDVSTGSSTGDMPAPGFTLRDQYDRPTSLADFRGKVVVLAFVDSHCTTVCPLMTESMVQALRLLGPAASQVQLLGINANPLATKVADVASYTRAHHMQSRWRFLTGPLPELEQVWRDYHVYVAAVHNDIDHQPIIVLIDGRGRERTIYSTQMSYEGVLQQADLLAQGISRLLPSHPPVRDEVSLEYIAPLKPASVVELTGVGRPGSPVALGRGHPHLLLFFAGWLTEDANLEARLAALDGYARLASRHDWPPPVAVNERPTEGSDGGVPHNVADLAAALHTPIVEDTQGRLGDGYGVEDLPWFVLTSASGQILWHHDGWMSAQALGEAVHTVTTCRSEQPSVALRRTCCGGEGGIRTHEHPLRCYWNSSPAPSTARPPLRIQDKISRRTGHPWRQSTRPARARMILRCRTPGPARAGRYSPSLAFGCGTLKDGGALRQGSVGPRGGGAGVSSFGTTNAWLVSGASRPSGTVSGGMVAARV